MNKIKEELKSLAKEIREKKTSFKQYQREHHGCQSEEFSYMMDSWHYRHRHIAYCLLRGRTIEEIEQKVNEGNERSDKLVEAYLDEYKKTLRDNSEKTE